jgi:hypothetical protein
MGDLSSQPRGNIEPARSAGAISAHNQGGNVESARSASGRRKARWYARQKKASRCHLMRCNPLCINFGNRSQVIRLDTGVEIKVEGAAYEKSNVLVGFVNLETNKQTTERGANASCFKTTPNQRVKGFRRLPTWSGRHRPTGPIGSSRRPTSSPTALRAAGCWPGRPRPCPCSPVVRPCPAVSGPRRRRRRGGPRPAPRPPGRPLRRRRAGRRAS